VVASSEIGKEESMTILRSLAIAVSVLAVFSLTNPLAQEPPAMPEPTEEHEVLGHWIGEWAGTGEMVESPFGPAGTMTWTEKCSWFGGSKFHVVCKSKGSSPMGETVGLGIMGYHVDRKVYTHYGVDSSGWAGFAEGTRSGDTWSFQSEDTMGGKKFHGRFSLTLVSDTEMKFNWEMSEDGENWIELMTGSSRKN
jgi:hypothetical protein